MLALPNFFLLYFSRHYQSSLKSGEQMQHCLVNILKKVFDLLDCVCSLICEYELIIICPHCIKIWKKGLFNFSKTGIFWSQVILSLIELLAFGHFGLKKKWDQFGWNFVHCVVWFLSKLVSDVSDLVCYSVTCFTCDICKPAKLNWTFVLVWSFFVQKF